MELEYDLTGGEMELWKLNQTPSRLWLPHPDIRISRHWMRDSWPHQNFYDRVQNHAPFLKWSSLYSPGEGEHRIAFPPANGIRFKWKFDHPTDPKTRESGRLLMSGWGGAWHDHYYDSWIRIQRLPGTRLSNLPLNWSLVPWAPVSTEPVGTGAAPKTTSPGP